jgi:CheY-like chemotaxis protein
VVQRVFEPFFTTKTGGAGSGLGLSMVYGFAKQSGGAIHIASEVGRGTTVILYLPLARTEQRSSVPPAAPKTASVAAYNVLLVEDEGPVRNTVRRQLETLGHTVVVADAAAMALAVLRTDRTIDVLLTDVVLGSGMNGIDLADAARRFRPGLPVIFMSGFTAVPEAQQRIRDSGAPLLTKPATLSQLEGALNAVTRSRQDTSTS